MVTERRKHATFGELIAIGILEIGDGYRAKNEELGGDGPIFLRAGHVRDTHIDFGGVERFHKHLEFRIRSKESKPGDAVVTTKGNSTGRTAFVTASMPTFVYSPHLSYWRSKDPDRLEAGFLRYWSKGPEFSSQLAGMKGSTDMAPYLSLLDQKRLRISLPPIREQRAIAGILGTLDTKIDLNRRMNETLEAMARALFKSWFVDFDPVRAKAEGRDPGLPQDLADQFPDRLVESELGEIPEEWKVGVLENALTEVEVGSRPKGGVSAYTDGVPSIGAESIVGLGIFDYSKTKYVPISFFNAMTKGRIRNRDVLLYKDGGKPGQFHPHVTMVGEAFPFRTAAINEHVYRLRSKDEFGQILLFFWLSSDFVMEEMRNKGTGVAIPGLNSTQLRSLTTLFAPKTIAQLFERLVEPFMAQIFRSCNEARTLTVLRDTLLPKLISGELLVKDAERLVGAHV